MSLTFFWREFGAGGGANQESYERNRVGELAIGVISPGDFPLILLFLPM